MTESTSHIRGISASQSLNRQKQVKMLSEFVHCLRVGRHISIFDCAAILGTDYRLLDDIECGRVAEIHTAFLINFINFIQKFPSDDMPVSEAEDLWSEIGRLSFNLRRKLGYSIDDIAACCGLKIKDIDDIECRHRANDKKHILKIIEFYVQIFSRVY